MHSEIDIQISHGQLLKLHHIVIYIYTDLKINMEYW